MVSQIVISIHALRVEGDRGRRVSDPACRYFYPRPPGGGRPLLLYLCSQNAEVISIHALRVEGDIAQNWRPRL